jgi:hypothetical protein
MTAITAELSLQLMLDDGSTLEVPSTFGYDPDDPYALTATLRSPAGNVSWVFARDLLQEGVYRRVGDGDLTIWPTISEDGTFVCLFLSSPSGEALLQASQQDVRVFLAAAYDLVPAGSEQVGDALDAELAHLLASEPNTR